MGSIFKPKVPKAPKAAPVEAVAQAASSDVNDVKSANEEELRKRKGFDSTIKAGETGGSNVLG